jgi:hypothetical protein
MDQAPPQIEAVEVGPLFRGASQVVAGMDGAFSTPIDRPGWSMWVFGDTLIGRLGLDGRRQIRAMPSCTAAVVDDAEWALGFPHARMLTMQVLDEAGLPKNHRRWPLDLVRGPQWLYYVEIETHGTGPLDFSVAGTGIAAYRKGLFRPVRQLWSQDQPAFGGCVLAVGGDTYLYAPGPKTFLARARGRLDDAAVYRYWDGHGWAKDVRAAAALPDAGPEASVRWNAYLHQFIMVDVPAMSHDLRLRFADHPEGPWSAGRTILTCQPADAQIYGGKQHVELDQDGGRTIVVTYNTNAPEPQLSDRPDVYWPRAVRVRFTR